MSSDPYKFHPRERRRYSPLEKAKMTAMRALHIQNRAPAFINTSTLKVSARDPMSIALAEIKAGVCPVCVVRVGVDGKIRVPPLRNPEFGNGGLWM